MAQRGCQAESERTPRERARHLLLTELGARRVANWCKVADLTVYKWLERGTDEEPIPLRHAPTIVARARAEGFDAPLAVLAPTLAEAVQ